MINDFFSPCPRGLEEELEKEVQSLGCNKTEKVNGGLSFTGSLGLGYEVNLKSFLATRVMLKVAQGWYKSEEDVYKIAKRVNWHDLFNVNLTIRLYVTAIKSPLRSLNFITLKVKDAVCDKFKEKLGKRPNVDTENPNVRIYIFLTKNECTLYLDLSGEPLWKRGYKGSKFIAPLKENLAAGIIRLCNWSPDQPFYDPMCGSGTFLQEACFMAMNICPGFGRNFAFEKYRNFEESLWSEIKNKNKKTTKKNLKVYGSDIDAKQVETAKRNLESAELLDYVQLEQKDFLETEAPTQDGVLVTNPPYGIRIGENKELLEWYPKLGDHLKKHFAGWNCYFFTGDMQLANKIKLKASRRTPLMNGKIDCRIFEYKMIQGGNR